jgi:uncharacterized membrane protein YoaK (UPF0700 family)
MTREGLLNSLLGFVAGFVDTCGFVALSGLFTAHVTGNFVLLGVSIATGSGGDIAKALTLPVFLLIVGLTCLLVHALEQRGIRALVPVLALEFVLLAAFLATGLMLTPFGGPDESGTLIVGALAVAAMAVQNGAMRRVLDNLTPTTVMTGNLTQVAVDATDVMLGGPRAIPARAHLRRVLPVVLAFALGAGLAGLGYLLVGFAALAAPVAVLGVAVPLAVGVRRGAFSASAGAGGRRAERRASARSRRQGGAGPGRWGAARASAASAAGP